MNAAEQIRHAIKIQQEKEAREKAKRETEKARRRIEEIAHYNIDLKELKKEFQSCLDEFYEEALSAFKAFVLEDPNKNTRFEYKFESSPRIHQIRERIRRFLPSEHISIIDTWKEMAQAVANKFRSEGLKADSSEVCCIELSLVASFPGEEGALSIHEEGISSTPLLDRILPKEFPEDLAVFLENQKRMTEKHRPAPMVIKNESDFEIQDVVLIVSVVLMVVVIPLTIFFC